MGVILIDTNHIHVIIIDMEIDSDLKVIWSAVVWRCLQYARMAFNKLYFSFLFFFQGIVLPNTSCSDNKNYSFMDKDLSKRS